jgi:lipoate-protein ligase A
MPSSGDRMADSASRIPHRGAIKLTGVETRSVTPGESASVEPVVPGQWEFWRSGPDSGPRNMAVDAALLRRASRIEEAGSAPRAGVWRCYGWSRPTVSFGRHERTRGRFDAASVAAAGLDAVRRPTGGRALLHSREVTYSATFPLAAGISWRVAYDAVNRILRDALASLGVDAAIVPYGNPYGNVEGRRTSPNAMGPLCFDRPDAGEIVVDGAKLAGSAVWRERGGYLQHGSILLHDDQLLLAAATCAPVPVASPAASLAQLLGSASSRDGPMDDEALRNAVEAAIAARLAANGVVTAFTAGASFDDDVDASARQLAASDWLWRR